MSKLKIYLFLIKKRTFIQHNTQSFVNLLDIKNKNHELLSEQNS